MTAPGQRKPTAGLPAASRYELLVKIASGGMATVYVGRLRGPEGFWRLVAIKRAHAHLVEDPSFRKMLIAEARLASRIHHPNVVSVEDVEELDNGELRLVMDYVEGSSLSGLLAAGDRGQRPLSARLAVRIALDACAGLHAAHLLADDRGEALRLVHRDVSPHNILVGVDGSARLADFGIAKVARSSVSTTTGAIKGKMGYMAPEYIEGAEPDARSDVFALGVVVWEAIAHTRLFRGHNEIDTLKRVVASPAPPLSSVVPELGPWLDDVIGIALSKPPGDRFDTAQAFAAALETAARKGDLIAAHREVATAVKELVGPALEARRELIRTRVAPEEPAPSTDGGTQTMQRPVAGEMPAAEPPAPDEAPDVAPAEALPSQPEPVADSSAVVPQTLTTIAGVPRRSTAWLIGAALAVGALSIGAIALGLSRRGAATAEPGGLVLPASGGATAAPEVTAPPRTETPAATSAAPSASVSPVPSPRPRPSAPAAPQSPSTAASPKPGPVPPATPQPAPPAAAPRETVAPNPYAPPKP